MSSRRYAVVSPCRDEADYLGRTLNSVSAQTEPPAAWILVDDGSTDETPQMLAEFARTHDYARVVTRPPRATRVLGSAVIHTFDVGLDELDLDEYDYVVKLDVDLDLPPTYFAGLMDRMEADPRLAGVSGVACTRRHGRLVPERGSFEMTVGMSKFYRVSAFREIGGFAPILMWDGIDCHTARSKGWKTRAFYDEELRFEHLRPMGSSDRGLLRGKRRHGRGQYLMGTHPVFMLASVLARSKDTPVVLGALHILAGYVGAAIRREPRHDDPVMRRQLRRFQWETLLLGRTRAVERWERRSAPLWSGASHGPERGALPDVAGPVRGRRTERRRRGRARAQSVGEGSVEL